ncbi:MAG: HD domain-containing protein, partial [Candidatus Peribacteraceae bacterium]|nr:HD domain-containing protein [Candidatus Peribacteraceae bacterium]
MDASFTALEEHLAYLSAGDAADVRRAFEFAAQAHAMEKRQDGTPYILHPLAVAVTLAEWGADRDTIIAALLHDVLEDTSVRKPDVLAAFGRHVAMLVEGVTKFTTADLSPDLPLDRKIETLRRLFEVMRLDVRSILIKLADRLHNLQTIDVLPPDRRRRFALETLTVYYRIAYHLGMRDVRRAFAEASVPHAYDDGFAVRDLRDRMCADAASVLSAIEESLRKSEDSPPVDKVFLQPRNLALFYDRVKKQGGKPLLRDAFSIVVIVRSEEDCYRMLQALHTRYRPISGQFRDFIAAPTEAGYRGIHTFVGFPEGGTVEVRIRTPEMSAQSRMGVVTSLFGRGPTLAPSFAWLRRSEELDLRTRESSSAFWEALSSDILQDSLPVSVDGKRISLPVGSTALDAAYALYDARAHCIVRINVNDQAVPLSHTLHEDDEVGCTFGLVHVVTASWLSMVATQHARFRIVDVLKQVRRSEKVTLGTRLLERELAHFGKGTLQGLSRARCERTTAHFHRESFDEVLAMVGDGTLRARDVFFDLFPERSPILSGDVPIVGHAFRLRITCMHVSQSDVLASLHSHLRMHGIVVHSLTVRMRSGSPTVLLSGSASDRMHLANFFDALESEEWTSSVQATLPFLLKAGLVGGVLLAFGVTIADLIFFPWYQSQLAIFGFFPQFLLQALPLLPILLATGYLLKLLSSHIVWMRSERWFLGVGFFLNFLGLLLLIFRMMALNIFVGVFPLLVTFTFALLVMGYAFLRVESLFAAFDEHTLHPLSKSEWIALRRKKIYGYGIRLMAICVWGVMPVFIRYTPVNTLSPLFRTFLLGVGASLFAILSLVIVALIKRRKLPSLRFPTSNVFLALLIGQ